MKAYLKLQCLNAKDRRFTIGAIREQMIARLGGQRVCRGWEPGDATIAEYLRLSSFLSAQAVDRWLSRQLDAALRQYTDHFEEASERSRAARVDDEFWMPAQAGYQESHQVRKTPEKKGPSKQLEVGSWHGQDSHGKFWSLKTEKEPRRKKSRAYAEFEVRRHGLLLNNDRRDTVRLNSDKYFGFAGKGDGFDEYVDRVEEIVAEEEQYERDLQLANRDWQQPELEMSGRELIALGDSLDAHLDAPAVYDLGGWLAEFKLKACKRGWPEDAVPQGTVVVQIDREKLADNVVLITAYGLRRVRRESPLSLPERDRVAREILADDMLYYPGDGHAGHWVDEDYLFDDYQGPENPRVLNGFNHPATGGETGILSNWSLASDLEEGDHPIDFRAFQGSRQRIRFSVGRGRRV